MLKSTATDGWHRFCTGLLCLALVVLVPTSSHAQPHGLVELRMSIVSTGGPPSVALTLDACEGKADYRILNMLVSKRIPATIFVTGKWLRNNPEAIALLKRYPELFEVENHGARHVPAIDRATTVYGLPSAGSPQAVRAEVEGGAQAIRQATGKMPVWFRGATAEYTATSMAIVRGMSFQLAGFSIAADGGGLLGTIATQRRIEAARDGDVILAHLNRPGNSAGQGIVNGVQALKTRGYRFVRLSDAQVKYASIGRPGGSKSGSKPNIFKVKH